MLNMKSDRKQSQELLQLAQTDALKALSLFKSCDSESPYDPEVITKVIQCVTQDQIKKAVLLLNDLQDEWTKQIALSDLAYVAASYDLSIAIEITNLCDYHHKPQILALIATDVIKSDIEAAKKIAESIEHFPSQVGVLASIASYSKDEEALDELLQIMQMKEQFGDKYDTNEALNNIAWRIAYNFPDKAIGLLKDIKNSQDEAIINVALNLKDTDRGITLIKTLLNEDSFPSLSYALGEMATMVAKKDRQKAMELVEEIQDKDERERMLLLLKEGRKFL